MRSRPSHLDADNDTSFQLSQKTLFSYLLCLPDKSEMSRVNKTEIEDAFHSSCADSKYDDFLHRNDEQPEFLKQE